MLMLENDAVKYLNDFVVLAKYGNYQHAADALYLSKSSLTNHIKILECSLRHKLFIASGHKLTLTEFGNFLYDYALRFLSLDSEYEEACSVFERESLSEVRIAVSSFMNCDHMVNMLWDHFSKDYPQYHLSTGEFHMGSLSPEELFTMGYELIFALSSSPNNNQYHCYSWAESTMVAILPLSHPLAKRESIRLGELSDESFILFPVDYSMHQFIAGLCQKEGFQPKVRFTIHGNTNLIELVSAGLGVSMSTYNETRNPFFLEKTAIIPLDPPANVYLNLYYQKKHTLSPPAKAFFEYAKNMHQTHKNDIPFYGPEVGVENVFF